MDIKRKIAKLLTDTAVYFTVIVLIYSIIVALVHTDASEILVSGLRILFFFIFSLLFSFANLIYGIDWISAPIRLLCHYLLTIFAVYICLLLPAALRPSGMLVGFLFFTILYFVLQTIAYFFRKARRKRLEKKEEYTNKFSK